MTVTHQIPAPDPLPQSRRFAIKGWMVFAAVAVFVVVYFMVKAPSEPDRTPQEQSYLAALTVDMDEDLAVKAGHAACELIPTSGELYAKKWLAGVDHFSRMGAVTPTPNPLPALQANAVVEAAAVHLC